MRINRGFAKAGAVDSLVDKEALCGRLIADLIRDEGLRLKPYRCSAGKLSIGVGRNLDDVGISKGEAEHLLANDIARAMVDLDRLMPGWRVLDPARRRALLNMVFNMGRPRFAGFRKLRAAVAAGDFAGAGEEALASRWAGQVGARAERIAAQLKKGGA